MWGWKVDLWSVEEPSVVWEGCERSSCDHRWSTARTIGVSAVAWCVEKQTRRWKGEDGAEVIVVP